MANATRQASIFVNADQATHTAKNIAGAYKKASNELALMVVGSDDYIKKLEEVRGLDAMLKNHRDSVRGIEKGWNLTKIGVDKFIGVAAGAFAVDSIIGYGKQLYGVGVQMDALDKKAKTVFGATLPQVTAEAEKHARAMGLTNAQYVAAATNIADLLIPLGFQRKEAADISTELVNLSGALSEWTGGTRTATEVSKILQSALTGEREQLKELGIVINEADIKANLASKGLDKLTGSALEQAKAAATLELILAKTTDAQAGFANGADSAIRRQAEFAAKLQETAEKLATLLLPVFERLLSLAAGVVDVVAEVVNSISDLVGVQNKASDATRESQTEFNTLIGVLKNVNATETTRNQAITELQSKYGSYIGNIDLHKATEAQLNDVLKKGNDLFVKRIFLQSQEEELADFASQRLELEKEIFENEKERAKIAQGGGFFDNANKLGEKANEAKRLAQELEVLNNKEAEFIKNQEEFAKKLNILPGETATSNETVITGKTKGSGTGTGDDKAKKQAKEDAELQARTAAQIKRAQELQGVLNALIEQESAKRTGIFKTEQEQQLDDYVENKEQQRLVDISFEEEKAAALQLIKDELQTDQEAQIEAIQNHYDVLIELAEGYGIDTAALKKKQADEIAAILKKAADEETATTTETTQARLAALGSMFTEFGNLATATFDLLGAEGEKSAAFQKVATLAKIAFDTAAAISSLVAASEANPANAVTFGAAGLAQYVAGIVRIVSNIAQAKKILSSAPQVKQKASGGFLSVTGADDGRTYSASVIPPPYTGLLPDHPVLFQSRATGAPVLASERGREYFVSAEALRNPYVANLTRMIDNIATSGGRGVAQFAEGGVNAATAPGTATTAATTDMALMRDLAASINTLNTLLSRGIVAVIPDRTLTAIPERLGKINDASGGYYG